MKPITFNCYRLNEERERAYFNTLPCEQRWSSYLPVECYDIIQVPGFLVNAKDLAKEGYPDGDKWEKLGIRFVVHRELNLWGGIYKGWTASEYSTSAKLLHAWQKPQRRADAILELGVQLTSHGDTLVEKLAEHKEQYKPINGEEKRNDQAI